MNGTDYTSALDELSASEGVFTTAQAARLDIPRSVLARASESGKLIRIAHGAYRSAATSSSEIDEAIAAWKLTAPDKMTYERMRPSNWDGIAVAGSTAASLLGLGDFYLSPYRFLAPQRFNTRNSEIRFGIRALDREDVSFHLGIPTTRPERTLIDLILDREDPSLIRNAYHDAAKHGIDEVRLKALAEQFCTSRRTSSIAKQLFRAEG